jgi:elongation factor 3
MDKTPNEYIRWRYQFGDDREGLDQANMKLSEEDDAALKEPVEFSWKDEKGESSQHIPLSLELTGER